MNQHVTTPASTLPSKIMSSAKGRLFSDLATTIPLNEFYLPEFVYRADMIPEDLDTYTAQDRNLVLDGASLHLTFNHGYPAVEHTTPFWERLPGEDDDAYNAYLIFLELPEKSGADNPIRLLPLIAQVSNIDITLIAEYSCVFFWQWRARAYDLFMIAALRKQREQRIMTIEGKHFKFAEDQLAKIIKLSNAKLDHVMRQVEAGGDEASEALEDLKIKDLVDTAEKLVKIQRTAIGLGNGTQVNVHVSDAPRHASVADEMKAISKESVTEQSTSQRPAEMDRILEDVDDLATLQDLIVRSQSPSGSKVVTTPRIAPPIVHNTVNDATPSTPSSKDNGLDMIDVPTDANELFE